MESDLSKMKDKGIKLWAYLMRLGNSCGCHQMPDRSFFFRQWQFPVCARCTGVLVGEVIGFILVLMGLNLSIMMDIVLLTIMLNDWLLQALQIKKSTNKRRFITGTLAGIAQIDLFIKLILQLIKLII